VRVGVVGAGIAGLMAARELTAAGAEVVLFDKGRSPGGRLATRRIAGARVDHGAQFFTTRSDEFARHVGRWTRSGLVFEWCRGFGSEPDGYPRYAVRNGMSALAKHLADGLDVRCNSLVFSLHRDERRAWQVKLDDASVHSFDALVTTCPLPQSYSLLVSAEVTVPEVLWRTDYERTLGLLAVLDRPSAIPAPGGVQHQPPFQFVADNSLKGISHVPALTVHADAGWSATHWDEPRDSTHAALVELAQPFLGDARIVESQVKRWRFATPTKIWPEPCWSPDDGTPVVLAGDAFAGPRVEGAALSGLAAAARLLA
jgi:renalase